MGKSSKATFRGSPKTAAASAPKHPGKRIFGLDREPRTRGHCTRDRHGPGAGAVTSEGRWGKARVSLAIKKIPFILYTKLYRSGQLFDQDNRLSLITLYWTQPICLAVFCQNKSSNGTKIDIRRFSMTLTEIRREYRSTDQKSIDRLSVLTNAVCSSWKLTYGIFDDAAHEPGRDLPKIIDRLIRSYAISAWSLGADQ